ncbi:sugar transferase [Singulisphaera sp. PoT]|uniref:sugar transferase n=1 Tax=Singulisphaera sp. PoT TaxID=3411797 RepID=UPI003BF57BFA
MHNQMSSAPQSTTMTSPPQASKMSEVMDTVYLSVDTNRRPSASLARYEFAKRIFDVVVTLGLLICSAPVMFLIALLVKVTSPGPIIFRQKRVGKDGREFWFYKFRSMVVHNENHRAELSALNQHGHTGVTFKMKNDPRITKVGRVIRKTSLDELPQLWNVLMGDMSLVGPRPALPAEVARYTPEQRRRLAVTPGLTCFWQIAGRANIPFEEQVRLDLEYIACRTLWVDASLLVKTVPALISGKGAY